MKSLWIPKAALKSEETFKAFLRDGSVAPYVSEEITRNKWVWFGLDNLAPERWRELADNSPPLGRCVDMSAMFMAGKGLEFIDKEGEVIEEAQDRFQEWMTGTTEEEFLEACFKDIALIGSLALDIEPLGEALLNGRRPVGRLVHRDASRLRIGKPDEEGNITNYWTSRDWTLYQRRKRYVPTPLNVWDSAKPTKPGTLYVKTYKQGKDFYGEPVWLPALNASESCVAVIAYNRTQMETGFSGTVHMHLETERDEADIDKLYDAVKDSYSGAHGEGIFVTFGRKGEEVKLTHMQRGDHAGELDGMYSHSEAIVVRTMLGPGGAILYGLEAKTGLDGADAALRQAAQLFERTYAEPMRRPLTRTLTKLMNLDGVKVWDCRIRPLEVVDARVDEVQDRQAYMRAVSVDEHRISRLNLPELGGEAGKRLLIEAGSVTDATPQQ